MKLKLEHINEETGVKVIVFNGDDIEKDLINAFYKLAGQLA